jgi:hypothetical protein
MEGMTVEQLRNRLDSAIIAGFGDCVVTVRKDDWNPVTGAFLEGNSSKITMQLFTKDD